MYRTARLLARSLALLPFWLLGLAPLGAGSPLQQVPLPEAHGLPSATDELVRRFLEVAESLRAKTRTPGAGIAIVADHRLVYQGGLGFSSLADSRPVTVDTLFAIGSCTKAFTGVLASRLVEQGRLRWEDPIREHLPAFQLSEPYVTRHASLLELMTHTTGLAGYNRLWYGSELTRSQLLEALPHLGFGARFGRKYIYNNLMYSVAGLALEEVAERSWHAQIRAEIFEPLGMDSSVTRYAEFQADPDRSTGYAFDGETALPHMDCDVVAPAGSIGSTVGDMAKWLRWVVSGGSLEPGPAVSQEQFAFLTAPQVVVDPRRPAYYGIGWEVLWRKGVKTIGHGGGIVGQNCYVRAVPSRGFGIVVLANQQSDFDDLLVNYAEDLFLHGDWEPDAPAEAKIRTSIAQAEERRRAIRSALVALAAEPPPFDGLSVDDYVGVFHHPGFPSVYLSSPSAGRLHMRYNQFEGPLAPQDEDHLVGYLGGEDAFQTMDLALVREAGGGIAALEIVLQRGQPPLSFARRDPARAVDR